MNLLLRSFLFTIGGAAAGYAIGRLIGGSEEEKQKYSWNGSLIGGGLGLGFSLITFEPKDSVNYIKYHKGKRVYDGVTTVGREDIRAAEHQRNGMKFDNVVYSEPKMRSEALLLECSRIKRYKPKYNIQHNSAKLTYQDVNSKRQNLAL